MPKLIIEGMTAKQIKVFTEWFEGLGEKQADEWFDINDVPAPSTDVLRPGGYRDIHDNGDITMYIRTY
jgi:hypothetical protein